MTCHAPETCTNLLEYNSLLRLFFFSSVGCSSDINFDRFSKSPEYLTMSQVEGLPSTCSQKRVQRDKPWFTYISRKALWSDLWLVQMPTAIRVICLAIPRPHLFWGSNVQTLSSAVWARLEEAWSIIDRLSRRLTTGGQDREHDFDIRYPCDLMAIRNHACCSVNTKCTYCAWVASFNFPSRIFSVLVRSWYYFIIFNKSLFGTPLREAPILNYFSVTSTPKPYANLDAHGSWTLFRGWWWLVSWFDRVCIEFVQVRSLNWSSSFSLVICRGLDFWIVVIPTEYSPWKFPLPFLNCLDYNLILVCHVFFFFFPKKHFFLPLHSRRFYNYLPYEFSIVAPSTRLFLILRCPSFYLLFAMRFIIGASWYKEQRFVYQIWFGSPGIWWYCGVSRMLTHL